MLVEHSRRLSPVRLTGAAVVAGVHGVVLSIVLALHGERATAPPAPHDVQVRLIDAPIRREAEPAPPILPVLRPAAPFDLPPLPDVVIEARPAPTIAQSNTATAASAPPATKPARAPAASAEDPPGPPAYVQQVEYLRFEPPAYPPLSRRLGERGLVVIRVHIDETGRPVEVAVAVSSGFHRLDEAAVRAVRAARFRPFVEGERARPALALVPIRFELG